jgi:hypothetical protein
VDYYYPVLSILDSTGSNLIYSTFLGYPLKSIYPAPKWLNLDLDLKNDVYISSCSVESGIPITSQAYDTSYNGNGDINVAKYAGCRGTPAIQTIKSLEFHSFVCDTVISDTLYIKNPSSCFLILKSLTPKNQIRITKIVEKKCQVKLWAILKYS